MLNLPDGIYLVEGTLDALQRFVPLRNPYFIHLLPHHTAQSCSASDLHLLATAPLEDQDILAPLALPTPTRLPAGLRLFQLASDLDGQTSAAARRILKARLGGPVQHLDLKPLVDSLPNDPSIAPRLAALPPAQRQEVIRLRAYPTRFFEALTEAENGVLPLHTPLSWSERLLQALTTQAAYSVWRSLDREQRYLLFQHQPPAFLDYLARRRPPYGVCPALAYYLRPFLRMRPLEEGLALFVRWVRFSRGLHQYTRNNRRRFYFQPSDAAIRLWLHLRIV